MQEFNVINVCDVLDLVERYVPIEEREKFMLQLCENAKSERRNYILQIKYELPDYYFLIKKSVIYVSGYDLDVEKKKYGVIYEKGSPLTHPIC